MRGYRHSQVPTSTGDNKGNTTVSGRYVDVMDRGFILCPGCGYHITVKPEPPDTIDTVVEGQTVRGLGTGKDNL